MITAGLWLQVRRIYASPVRALVCKVALSAIVAQVVNVKPLRDRPGEHHVRRGVRPDEPSLEVETTISLAAYLGLAVPAGAIGANSQPGRETLQREGPYLHPQGRQQGEAGALLRGELTHFPPRQVRQSVNRPERLRKFD